ncbi:DUF4232 domain-containing protein [Streptomyces sp. NPDC052682]|uniref:DUF4232 domain-containing protein n=1 Tax=Streptomyces sp. NPDC052682 TaxID=3154954 RepID=UPI0034385243
MRITHRLTTRAAASSLAVAALAFAGVQATAQTAAAAPGKAAAIAACTTANTEVTVSDVRRPINHLLVTATNTSTKPCNAYGAPYLGFGGGQAAVPWLEDSKPQAVVTLAPGESAYAGIGTYTPDGGEGTTYKTVDVLFANKAMNGSVGKAKTLTLPDGGTYVNDSAFVTYWQDNVADALVF